MQLSDLFRSSAMIISHEAQCFEEVMFIWLISIVKSFKIRTSRVEYLKDTFWNAIVSSFSVSVDKFIEDTFLSSSDLPRFNMWFAANLALVKPKQCYWETFQPRTFEIRTVRKSE